MTSLSHVEILRRGPQAWNEWRAQNPAERPHLSNVALSLSERQWGPMHGGPINFKSAILPDASLRFASLLDADLQAADLTRADLVHARLDRANLKNAILKDAVLDHADFADAHLRRAILTGASLRHARNLTQDQINESIGDASTALPAHLERPTAWTKVAPTRLPTQTSYRKAIIASASACLVGGALLFGVSHNEQHPKPTTGATKFEQPATSSQASEGSTKKSSSESMVAPEEQQANRSPSPYSCRQKVRRRKSDNPPPPATAWLSAPLSG